VVNTSVAVSALKRGGTSPIVNTMGIILVAAKAAHTDGGELV
jgi:hypothetical protein